MADDPAICERPITRKAPGQSRPDRDCIAVEAPLELRIRGQPAVVLMRTPGDDEELITGYLIGEGFADRAGQIGAMSRPLRGRCGHGDDPGAVAGDVVDLPDADLPRDPKQTRSLYSSSSCGACGKTDLGELAAGAAPILSGLSVTEAALAALPDRLRAAQTVFAATGGLHAAGAFTPDGELLAAREDVGRHNAVDKLVGWAARAAALPMDAAILCVSGRLSFEILQKAIAAGFPIVAAVSAPSSLAVDLAERYRVTLCGFVRDGRFNVYAHPSRVG